MDALVHAISCNLNSKEALGAFADDIGIVVTNVWKTAPILQILFQQFQAISALSLNVSKTVLIPLWQFMTCKNMRTLLRETCPKWSQIAIRKAGKYLGFYVGPEAYNQIWQRPLSKL